VRGELPARARSMELWVGVRAGARGARFTALLGSMGSKPSASSRPVYEVAAGHGAFVRDAEATRIGVFPFSNSLYREFRRSQMARRC